MNTAKPATTANLRQLFYQIIIIAALALVVGRIINISPYAGTNAVSRFNTIRALGDEGTYIIDTTVVQPGWGTIDRIQHFGRDGQLHYYSDKPTFLPTILAGEYLVIKQLTGLSFAEHPLATARLMLIITNGGLFTIWLILFARLLERYGKSDWGKLFVFTAAAFGTSFTTFATTLNNHLPAAAATLAATYFGLAIWQQHSRQAWHGYAAGALAATAAALELPATAFLLGLIIVLLLKAPRFTLTTVIPAATLIALAAFGTNVAAHDTLLPPYLHLKEGKLLATISRDLSLNQRGAPLPPEFLEALAKQGQQLSAETKVEKLGRYLRLNDTVNQQVYELQITEESFILRRWNRWYQFPGSYWNGEGAGLYLLDRGEPSRLRYAWHMLGGHHGFFSLTPLWLLSLVGLCQAFIKPRHPFKPLAIITTALSLIVLIFYLQVPLQLRNYGGGTSSMRWFMWLIPFWLLMLLPAADTFRKHSIKITALTLLAISIGSAMYAIDHPWQEPWLFKLLEHLHWIDYRRN